MEPTEDRIIMAKERRQLVPYSDMHIWRLEKTGAFPLRIKLSPNGRVGWSLTVHIMAAMAEHEREMISQRTKAALQAAKERGTKLGWSTPSRKKEQRQATLKANQANREHASRFAANVLPIVREIEKAGITTLKGMAEALNARGVHTARGGKWYPTTVKNLIGRELAA